MRDLQHALAGLEGGTRDERFVAFFLNMFVDDVLYNLAGDIPYDKRWGSELDSTRKALMDGIADQLMRLIDGLTRADSLRVYDACVEMAAAYTNGILALDRLLRTHSAAGIGTGSER